MIPEHMRFWRTSTRTALLISIGLFLTTLCQPAGRPYSWLPRFVVGYEGPMLPTTQRLAVITGFAIAGCTLRVPAEWRVVVTISFPAILLFLAVLEIRRILQPESMFGGQKIGVK